jgi:hypothetical protein
MGKMLSFVGCISMLKVLVISCMLIRSTSASVDHIVDYRCSTFLSILAIWYYLLSPLCHFVSRFTTVLSTCMIFLHLHCGIQALGQRETRIHPYTGRI